MWSITAVVKVIEEGASHPAARPVDRLLSMAIDWSIVTSDHIREACRRLDAGEVVCRSPARNTFMKLQGRTYPGKFIRGLAYEVATGRRLDPNTDFAGGKETARFLTNLGFDVDYEPGPMLRQIPRQESPRQPDPTTRNEVRAENTVSLGVIEQKQALQRVLEDRFNEITVNHPFDWLVVPEIHAECDLVRRLRERLASHRNFNNFSTPGRALRCDFYIPRVNLIIEYDERQHFTEPRALTLELYPSTLSLGFDARRWLNACRKICSRDNDPPYRDEQRAFYDALRDILSQANGTRLIRIKHGDWDWSRPGSGQYLTEIFRQLGVQDALSQCKRKTRSRIEVRYDEDPQLARLVIAGRWDGNLVLCRELLEQVCTQWPTNARPHCLVTCGASLRFAWPEQLVPGSFFAPEAATVKRLRDAAERVVRDLLKSELVLRLRRVTRYLTLGVDSPLQNKVTTTGNRITSPHVELVCIVDLNPEPFRLCWTGKSYPTTGQADRLVRETDLNSHFLMLNGIGEVLVLGCHDLTMFNPRAQASARGWREDTWKAFEALAKRRKPLAVLYHVFERLTRCGFSNRRRHDSFWRTMEIRHVCAGCPSDGFYRTSASRPRQAVQGCRLCPSSAGACRDF